MISCLTLTGESDLGGFFIMHCKKKCRKIETNIPRKGISEPQSQFPHSCVCEQIIYSHDGSAFSAGGNMWTDPLRYSQKRNINTELPLQCVLWLYRIASPYSRLWSRWFYTGITIHVSIIASFSLHKVQWQFFFFFPIINWLLPFSFTRHVCNFFVFFSSSTGLFLFSSTVHSCFPSFSLIFSISSLIHVFLSLLFCFA